MRGYRASPLAVPAISLRNGIVSAAGSHIDPPNAPQGAATGMLRGGLAALACTTLINVSDLKVVDLGAFWAANPLIRIRCEQPAIWTVPLAIGLMIVISKATSADVPSDIRMKMLVLHAPEKLGLKQECIQEHQAGAGH